jgi:hypothetical protein
VLPGVAEMMPMRWATTTRTRRGLSPASRTAAAIFEAIGPPQLVRRANALRAR